VEISNERKERTRIVLTKQAVDTAYLLMFEVDFGEVGSVASYDAGAYSVGAT
jgi:hypothetical protein